MYHRRLDRIARMNEYCHGWRAEERWRRIRKSRRKHRNRTLQIFAVLPQASPGATTQSDCYLKSEFLVL